jgi:hypothetical protein
MKPMDHMRACLAEFAARLPRNFAGVLTVTRKGQPDRGGYLQGVYYGTGAPIYTIEAWTDRNADRADVRSDYEYEARSPGIAPLRAALASMYPTARVIGVVKSPRTSAAQGEGVATTVVAGNPGSHPGR